jgi:molybdopterin synthase sulfur carrier subunit
MSQLPGWQVRVRYFAALREALGEEERLQVPVGTTVGALRTLLQARSTEHARRLDEKRAVRAALDRRMCAADALLHEGAEVAFFPPVTGG